MTGRWWLHLVAAFALGLTIASGAAVFAQTAEETGCPAEEVARPTALQLSFPGRLGCRVKPQDECKICAALKRQLAAGCQPGRGDRSAYADTIFRRMQPDYAVSDAARRMVIAAQLSQDPVVALELTAAVRNSSDVGDRFFANTVVAFIAARAGAVSRQRHLPALIAALRRDAGTAGLPPVDILYLEALLALDKGNSRAADRSLSQSLALDPANFQAAALLARVRARRATVASRRSRLECNRAYAAMFEAMVLLMDLRPCPRQAAHVETYLERAFRQPDREPVLSVAGLYLGILARQPAYAEAAVARFAARPHFACKAEQLGRMKRILGDLLADRR